MEDDYNYIWIFMGRGGDLPSGVFSSREKAVKYVKEHKLVGHIAKYPVDISTYDWVVEKGYKIPDRMTRQGFTTGWLDHEHFEDIDD